MPREKKVVAMLEAELEKPGADRETEHPAPLRALEGQIAKMGAAAGLLVILTIYVMTAKPFL
jgi:hypothetical protein